MTPILDRPVVLSVLALIAFAVATRVGMLISRNKAPLRDGQREDFNLVLGATLTLLSLIIGFSFSMAISRFDQRKSLEEAEANAIGTAYARADFLDAAFIADAKKTLRDYTDLRIAFYRTGDRARLKEIATQTARVQEHLWATTVAGTRNEHTPLSSIAAVAMNDVLNSQGYTQAAWWNRIPIGAWSLMISIGLMACLMFGYGARAAGKEPVVMLLLPLIVSISILLIADIDSPRGGSIQVVPQNLIALSDSFGDTKPPDLPGTHP